MDLKTLESRLPNGFHDAEILSISVNYAAATALIDLNLSTGTPGGTDPDEYRRGRLTIHGLHYLVCDPPETLRQGGDGEGLWVTTLDADAPGLSPGLAGLIRALPRGAFCHRLYVAQWNSFIHLSAQAAELTWTPKTSAGGPRQA